MPGAIFFRGNLEWIVFCIEMNRDVALVFQQGGCLAHELLAYIENLQSFHRSAGRDANGGRLGEIALFPADDGIQSNIAAYRSAFKPD